ncbi:hypothetical protein SELMODRAFT_410422 [Selaginella moellendorffii]|uniref:Uncharacterized protein n=1 Tax=Selaginella moellendorffii TaxID=88036 RepID=D8REP8_SELML|nr:hypothetical protein SELMODRAFT_410422 [Selaginella moellendorffii]
MAPQGQDGNGKQRPPCQGGSWMVEEPLSRFSNYWYWLQRLSCCKREALTGVSCTLTEKEDGGRQEGRRRADEALPVKWKSRSYLHCSWILLNDMERASRMKMNQFHKTCEAMKQCPTRAE